MQHSMFIRVRLPGLLNTFLAMMCMHLCKCTNPEGGNIKTTDEIIYGSLSAIGDESDREKLVSLVSLADCVSPNGKYTTETHTASGGYSYFKQVYSYKPKPFEAVIQNKDYGYILSDSLMALDKETISMIRSHEFHNIILEVDKRFHDFEKPEKPDSSFGKTYRINAKDELGNACSLFFDSALHLLNALDIKNPVNKNEIIKMKFSNWRKVQELLLPYHVEIDQVGKIYTFNYTSIVFNSPAFKAKKIKP